VLKRIRIGSLCPNTRWKFSGTFQSRDPFLHLFSAAACTKLSRIFTRSWQSGKELNILCLSACGGNVFYVLVFSVNKLLNRAEFVTLGLIYTLVCALGQHNVTKTWSSVRKLQKRTFWKGEAWMESTPYEVSCSSVLKLRHRSTSSTVDCAVNELSNTMRAYLG